MPGAEPIAAAIDLDSAYSRDITATALEVILESPWARAWHELNIFGYVEGADTGTRRGRERDEMTSPFRAKGRDL